MASPNTVTIVVPAFNERDSIAAVMNPENTSALFMVADGTGGHWFASTLEEHNANVAKWYAIRRERGEM